MSYQNPRNRLEVRLKEIIDNSAQISDPRSRFELLLAAIVDEDLSPDDLRDRIELYLGQLGGRASGGGITPSGTVPITANGLHNVAQYEYANVQVPATPDTQELIFTISSTGSASHIITPPAGYLYSKVTLVRDDDVFKAENIKKDVTIYGVTGTYDAGGLLRYDSRQLACTGSHTVTLGWRPEHIIVSYAYKDPYYDPGDPDQDEMVNYHLDLTQTTDITGEDDYVTFTSTGYTFVSMGTGFNDYPETYSKLTFTAMAVS